MPSVQIKDVPADVHSVLRQRAAAASQSLQEYLRGRLIAEARQPTLDELLKRADARAGGSTPLQQATRLIREDRDAARKATTSRDRDRRKHSRHGAR